MAMSTSIILLNQNFNTNDVDNGGGDKTHGPKFLQKFLGLTHIYVTETCRRANSSVLVHCGAGISRSATIVVAYLMWYLKLPFMASYKFVQKLRPQISPNLNFVGQLVAFGNDLPNMVCNDLKNAESQQQQQTRKRCWSEKTETDNSCLVPQRKKQGPTKSVYSADIISF